MHEASLLANLMRRAEEVAQAEGAHRVVGMSVWLGALSHLSAEHFTEHFNRASVGTMAEGASLELTVSEDPNHPDAQSILLEKLEVEV
jgi:hydrogenase nickel incorporation protein HypA/HybF